MRLFGQTPLRLSARGHRYRAGDDSAHPVHDGGVVFAVSQAGQTAAFNARSGLLLWDQPIGGIEMPAQVNLCF